ncbi:hypothetical protein CDL12_18966 [Handroanthus impetiginosus]|uniref:Uncharacterized protein n=1 Tax=Handroanthus impetiginosus TaxID=429701 RepID=A0A2G9GT54_9LAMI|nr:hypothetical protein CDL12_18966 [Handroanthus impetiginosus]
MSRCFPFPPPGYERKHRPEDLDVLKQAKQKEKKHKKEQKDKERRKDKEKKEKDGSGEKHRDKKDRKEKRKDKKEKHRDKKDRGKDKEKSSISEDSTVAGRPEEESGEKLHPKGHSKDRSSVVDEGKCSTLIQGQNGGKPFQSILPSQATTDSKFMQQLDRRIRDDQKGRGSQLPERVASVDKSDQETAARTAVRNHSGLLAEERSNNGIKRDEIRKMDAQELGNEFTGKAMVQNLTRLAKGKVEGIPRPVGEQNDWRLEDKEKYKEAGNDMHGDKHGDKKSHGKDKDKEKVKKKEEKAMVKTENRKSAPEKSKDVERNDLVFATSNKGTSLLKVVDSTALSEGNLRKRKDTDTNGFLHESEIRPNKIQRPAVHHSGENGRKLEASQIPSKCSSDKHAVPHNVPLDHRDRSINGTIRAPKPSPSKPSRFVETTVADQVVVAPKVAHHDPKNVDEAKIEDLIAEALRRPPHPDSKYLSQVLTVPTVGDWSANDDEDWLFSKKDPPNKPKLELTGVKGEPQVWSEAVHIESADVFALPYVLPY